MCKVARWGWLQKALLSQHSEPTLLLVPPAACWCSHNPTGFSLVHTDPHSQLGHCAGHTLTRTATPTFCSPLAALLCPSSLETLLQTITPTPPGQLLALRDPVTQAPLSLAQLKSELVIATLAGFETTSNALSWTLGSLAAHPQALEALVLVGDGSGRVGAGGGGCCQAARSPEKGRGLCSVAAFSSPCWLHALCRVPPSAAPSDCCAPPAAAPALAPVTNLRAPPSLVSTHQLAPSPHA